MMVRIYPEDGQSLSEQAIAAIHELSDKDLIKSVEEGSVVFTVGPFDDKSQVDALVAALKATGVENITVTENPQSL